MDNLEDVIKTFRDSINDMDNALDYLDSLVKNDSKKINNLDNFIWRLKLDNLYNEDIENFINNYIEFYNN